MPGVELEDILKEENNGLEQLYIRKENIEGIKMKTLGKRVTADVGGYQEGDLITKDLTTKQLLEEILFAYVPASLTSIAINPGWQVEVGTNLTIVSAVLAWQVDSEGHVPYSVYINGPGFTGIHTPTAGSSGMTVDAAANTKVKKTTNTYQDWVFEAKDKNGANLPSVYDRVDWLWRRFFGASSTEVTDQASFDIVMGDLNQSAIDRDQRCTYYADANNNDPNKWTYIVYNVDFPDLTSIIQDGATPVLGAFVLVGEFSFVNSQGLASNQKVYKTNNKGAFGSGTKLDIT